MRRGRGSRGSRSRSPYRSSRRHHRRYGRRHRYYGYGYGYGYGYRRGGGFVIILVVMGIILFLAVIGISSSIGSSKTYDVNLGPHETRLYHPNTDLKNEIEIIDLSGVIETHFFETKPAISSNRVSRDIQENDLQFPPNSVEFWELYLIKGSSVIVSWTADQLIEFYIVKGDSDFNKWKEGENTQKDSKMSASGSYTLNANSDDDYYFTFFNSGSSTVGVSNITYYIESAVYEISNSQETKSGSFSKSISDNPYIVFYNPSATNDISIEYIENPKYSFGLIFGVMMITSVLIFFVIYRLRKSKSTPTVQTSQIQPSRSSQPIGVSSPAPIKALHHRPSPKFCNACGSGLLPNSEFCSECGTKV